MRMSDPDRELHASCTRRLSGHKSVGPADTLKSLADHPAAAQSDDVYGKGEAGAQAEAAAQAGNP